MSCVVSAYKSFLIVNWIALNIIFRLSEVDETPLPAGLLYCSDRLPLLSLTPRAWSWPRAKFLIKISKPNPPPNLTTVSSFVYVPNNSLGMVTLSKTFQTRFPSDKIYPKCNTKFWNIILWLMDRLNWLKSTIFVFKV